jgi:hypothetical protein
MGFGVLGESSGGVGTLQRVGLSEKVVGEIRIAIRIRTVDLGEGGVGTPANLGFLDPEQSGYVAVTLAARQQKLEQRTTVLAQSHGFEAYGFMIAGICPT